MRIKLNNVLWKSSQSLLGLALVAVQSHIMSKEDLAKFALAQSLIVMVTLFDFGLGVQITNWIVRNFNDNDCPRWQRRSFGLQLLISRKYEIITVAIAQCLIFGAVFAFLVETLLGEVQMPLTILFALGVFLNSVGINFGKLFIATGEIGLLVQLQAVGALLAFLMSVLGAGVEGNLYISVFATSLSSLFIGSIAVFGRRKTSNPESALKIDSFLVISKTNSGKFTYLLQLGQLMQFIQPIVVQYILVSELGPTEVVAYLICQRLMNSIANVFGTEIQLNYSIPSPVRKITGADVMRFKLHYFGFLSSALAAVIFMAYFWSLIFSTLQKPTVISIISFVPLGLLLLVDQAIRFRLYVLEFYLTEMLSNLAYLGCFLVFSKIGHLNTFMEFNLCLILAYIPKLLIKFRLRIIPIRRNDV